MTKQEKRILLRIIKSMCSLLVATIQKSGFDQMVAAQEFKLHCDEFEEINRD